MSKSAQKYRSGAPH